MTELTEFLAEPDEPSDWGPWRLKTSTRELSVRVGKQHSYEVDLDDCTTSAQVLDWMMQVAGKSWADDATIAGLVRALDDVLRPQANLCSGGRSKELTGAAIRRLVREARRP